MMKPCSSRLSGRVCSCRAGFVRITRTCGAAVAPWTFVTLQTGSRSVGEHSASSACGEYQFICIPSGSAYHQRHTYIRCGRSAAGRCAGNCNCTKPHTTGGGRRAGAQTQCATRLASIASIDDRTTLIGIKTSVQGTSQGYGYVVFRYNE